MLTADPALIAAPAPNWTRRPKKTLYTLNIGNYAPELRELTYPLMKDWARKIGADFQEITERKFPEWPVTYEKLQIYELAKVNGGEWNYFVDADAVISPEFFDPTEHMQRDTMCHNGRDMAGIRWSYDQYFRRDGRNWGSCNWFTVASDWCLDIWRPLDDLTPEQAFANINITIGEHNSGHCKTEHLIDDYTLSRNIARFGIKATTVTDICANIGFRMPDGRGHNPFLWHKYTISNKQKFIEMLGVLAAPKDAPAFPFGIQGQVQPAANGQPAMMISHDSLYGPKGAVIGVVGIGLGLMSMEQAVAVAKKWGAQ